MKTQTLLAGMAALTFGTAVSADVISGVTATYTGTAPEVGGINLDDESNIVNGNGLSATPAADESDLATVSHAGASFSAPGNAWATTDPGGGGSDFFASTSDTVIFEFDLGGTHTVDSIAVWGYHFNDGKNGNSISDITLDFSTDGGTSTDSSQTVAVSLPGTFNLATIVGLSATSANHITMTVNDNHFGNPGLDVGGGDRVGISEIAFTNTVPEPGSLALLGLGGLLFARRRRG